MPKKRSSLKFAELISTGIVVIFCGIGAISLLVQNLVVACILGTIGLVLGVTVWRTEVEKLEKISATIGIALSIIPFIYALVIFTRR